MIELAHTTETESKPDSGFKESEIEDAYFALLEKAPNKGCGRFQIVLGSIAMLGWFSAGYIQYGLSYYELMPQFNCQLNGAAWAENCSRDQICRGAAEP